LAGCFAFAFFFRSISVLLAMSRRGLFEPNGR
jgi:hypothetical protein